MSETLTPREQVAMAMRESYAKLTGEDLGMIPFATAPSRDAWLTCADTAIEILKKLEEADAKRRH